MKKAVLFLIVSALSIFPVCAAERDGVISDTAEYVLNIVTNPTVSSIGGEWAIIGLLGSGEDIPKEYLDLYYSNVENAVREAKGVLSSRKYTEYSRVVTALSVMGKNPQAVAGYDLVSPLYDFDAVTRQGLNGSIWALIALDSGNYGDSVIRGKYVRHILDRELKSGGWSLSKDEESADCDVTAMAITALSGYTETAGVLEAVNRGRECLKAMQNDDGGFSTYGEATAESTAQVITALSSLGEDLDGLSKNGKTPLDALLKYYKKGEGFSHILGGESNLMATEQALYALASVKRFKEGKGSVFAAESKKVFFDIAGSGIENEISALNKIGVISGTGGGLFSPEKRVTRAEFATMAVKSLGISENADCNFSDVKKSDWFYPYVSAAYENGIVFGVSEREFNPQGEITCEEAAAMLERSAKRLGICADFLGHSEINHEISDWAEGSYIFCLDCGILAEEKEPKKALNRAEIAQMIYNMLKKAEIL